MTTIPRDLTAADLIAVVRSLPGLAPLTDLAYPAYEYIKECLIDDLSHRGALATIPASECYAEGDGADVLWLCEQVGVPREELLRARDAAQASDDDELQGEYVRAILPWPRVEPLVRAVRETLPDAPRLSSIDTPEQLLRLLEKLSPDSPITDEFSARWRGTEDKGQSEQKGVWYGTQHEHWMGWLGNYDGPGGYDRKDWKRSAAYVYNHVVNPQMLVYLAEAAGISPVTVREAMDAALAKSGSSMSAMSAAVRKVVPWSKVEQALLEL